MGKKLLETLGPILELGGTLGRGLSAQERAEANAEIDKKNAAQSIEESRRRAFEIQRRGRQAAGAEKVRAAGAGFTQEGTSLQLQIDQLEAAEFNSREEIRVGRAAESRSLESAALNVKRGKTARRTSFLDAASKGITVLGKSRAKKINATN
jgi:hypothetical protein